MDAKNVKRIAISEPLLDDEEWHALREPLQTGWLTQGPKVAAFEKAFAKRHDARHALATTSCTTALHLCLAALGVGPGDEVIVPSFTWIATANAVLYCGATPVICDVDRTTNNIDIAHAASLVSARTKAVMAVHLFGLCVDVDALRKALPAGIAIVEDAACAAGAHLRGRSAGTLGEAAAFSFHPRKSITTGEGGMVTTGDDAIADRVRVLRNHGASVSEEERHRGPAPHILPDFDVLGFNYRMTDLQGAVGLVQLGKLDRFIDERAEAAKVYQESLGNLGWLSLPAEPAEGRHAWQAYVAYVHPDRAPLPRDEIMGRLQAQGIATRPGTHSIHLLDYYKERLGIAADALPGARDCARNTIALPLHNRMSPEDYQRVIAALRSL
jgi:dTDP-4-amino-4,6-dideoxygalactose transaminase